MLFYLTSTVERLQKKILRMVNKKYRASGNVIYRSIVLTNEQNSNIVFNYVC